MYQLYLFDFDYTLARSEKGILLCFRRVLDRYGYTDLTDDALRRVIGYTLADGFRMLTGQTDPAVLDRYWREYEDEAHRIMTDNTTLYPDAIPVLTALKDAGAKVGIISSKHRSLVTEAMERYGAMGYIDLLVGVSDVARAKPDPAGILFALETLGAAREETLYCGDSFIDAQAAQNAGVPFAAVTTGTNSAADFAGYPCVAVMERLGRILEL